MHTMYMRWLDIVLVHVQVLVNVNCMVVRLIVMLTTQKHLEIQSERKIAENYRKTLNKCSYGQKNGYRHAIQRYAMQCELDNRTSVPIHMYPDKK